MEQWNERLPDLTNDDLLSKIAQNTYVLPTRDAKDTLHRSGTPHASQEALVQMSAGRIRRRTGKAPTAQDIRREQARLSREERLQRREADADPRIKIDQVSPCPPPIILPSTERLRGKVPEDLREWLNNLCQSLAPYFRDLNTDVDRKIRTYVQDAAPTSGIRKGDLWIDSNYGNRLYRWNGSAWVDMQDTGIATAIAAAADAQADGGWPGHHLLRERDPDRRSGGRPLGQCRRRQQAVPLGRRGVGECRGHRHRSGHHRCGYGPGHGRWKGNHLLPDRTSDRRRHGGPLGRHQRWQ